LNFVAIFDDLNKTAGNNKFVKHKSRIKEKAINKDFTILNINYHEIIYYLEIISG
jgi:hypothetical protein